MRGTSFLTVGALGAALALAAPALAFSPGDPAREPAPRDRLELRDSSEAKLMGATVNPSPNGGDVRLNGITYSTRPRDPFEGAFSQLTGHSAPRDNVTYLGVGAGAGARYRGAAPTVEDARPARLRGDHSCTDCSQTLVDGMWVLD